MSQTQRRYVADSEALSASNRRSWIGFNSPDRSPSPLRWNAYLRLVCDVYFYVNSCRRDGADKINAITQKSVMNLELVYDASATPSGCCRRHDCDVTALYVNQAWVGVAQKSLELQIIRTDLKVSLQATFMLIFDSPENFLFKLLNVILSFCDCLLFLLVFKYLCLIRATHSLF